MSYENDTDKKEGMKKNQEDIPVINTDTGLLRTLESKLNGFWACAVGSGLLTSGAVYFAFERQYKMAVGLALLDVCTIMGTTFLKDEIITKYTRR